MKQTGKYTTAKVTIDYVEGAVWLKSYPSSTTRPLQAS